MNFIWDGAKCQKNISKHGIDFVDVQATFSLPMLTGLDDRKDYGEDRHIGIGMMRNIVIVVAYTEPGEDTIRIISARKATKSEREKYEHKIKDQLG